VGQKICKKFVIELEGEVHEYQRVLVLAGLRLTTLRIRNNELQDIDSVKGGFAEPPNLGISFIICRFSMSIAHFLTQDHHYYVR